jgi:membrane protease YdiL (CAAX protease family)
MTTPVAVAVVLAVLGVMNVWVYAGPAKAHPVTGPVAAALLLLVGKQAGLSWEALGLGRDSLLSGVVYGAVCAGIVAVVYAVGVTVPATRRFFRDTRYRTSASSVVFTAFLAIPLGTVVFEEVGFRGVLWGLVEDAHGALWATLVTSVLFGLWHVLPALHMARTHTAVPSSDRGRLLAVLGTVAFTTVAGVVFAQLRDSSGSLVAPALFHWATNSLGVLAAARVWAISSD